MIDLASPGVLRLARFNVQAGSADKRYFVGMPSPAAAGVLASTVYAYPTGLTDKHWALPVVAIAGIICGVIGGFIGLVWLLNH